MSILGIDPGTTHSGLVLWDSEKNRVTEKKIIPNNELVRYYWRGHYVKKVCIEMIASYGMPVGRTTFETCVWIGRFIESTYNNYTEAYPDIRRIYRKQIVAQICNSGKAKDANVRQALLDRFPASGGGKTPQVGTKAQPGPLYGFKSHLWSALAVAVAGHELWNSLERFLD